MSNCSTPRRWDINEFVRDRCMAERDDPKNDPLCKPLKGYYGYFGVCAPGKMDALDVLSYLHWASCNRFTTDRIYENIPPHVIGNVLREAQL